MGQQGVDISKKISKFFDLTFTGVHMDRLKLVTILENKVVQKFSSNGNNKKPSFKLIFYNEKK